MGLTIHYSLEIEKAGLKAARRAIHAMHKRAMDMPFKEVSEIAEFKGDQCDFLKVDDNSIWRWMLCQAQGTVIDGNYSYGVTPERIIAFEAYPGDGCEPADFGLCLYPKTIERDGKKYRTGYKGWSQYSFCKTQYASQVSTEHFLRCHLLVISMLDYAKELGILKKASDEGKYWEKRNGEALAKEVGEWNEMIAGHYEAMKDAFGIKDGQVVSPITGYSDFEHLEAKGAEKMTDTTKKITEEIAKISTQPLE